MKQGFNNVISMEVPFEQTFTLAAGTESAPVPIMAITNRNNFYRHLLCLTVGAGGNLDAFTIQRAPTLNGPWVTVATVSTIGTASDIVPQAPGWVNPPVPGNYQVLLNVQDCTHFQLLAGSTAGTTLTVQFSATQRF